jgi:Predicted signal-transduction protein containing cAMP-binding and CBS domains
MLQKLVKDIMRHDILVTASPDTKLLDAIKKMANYNVGSVVVLENERIVGILTERDVVKALAKGISLEEKVENVMTKNPITISYNEYINKALFLMSENNIRHLPVVNKEGKLVGMISIRDIAKVRQEWLIE